MEIKKIWVKFNLNDSAKIIDGCHRGEYGKVERITYDREGLKYDIRLADGRLCSEVIEEDLLVL